MPYRIELTRMASRALRKLPKLMLKRIDEALLALAVNPRPPGAVSLQHGREFLRIRVGAYRIVYTVREDRLVILVIRIGHRGEVYRKL